MFDLNRSLSLNTAIFTSLPRFLHYASTLSIFTGDLKTDCRYVWTNFFRSIGIAFDFNFFPYAKVLSLHHLQISWHLLIHFWLLWKTKTSMNSCILIFLKSWHVLFETSSITERKSTIFILFLWFFKPLF